MSSNCCDVCGTPMTERVLFTSTYFECVDCIGPDGFAGDSVLKLPPGVTVSFPPLQLDAEEEGDYWGPSGLTVHGVSTTAFNNALPGRSFNYQPYKGYDKSNPCDQPDCDLCHDDPFEVLP